MNNTYDTPVQIANSKHQQVKTDKLKPLFGDENVTEGMVVKAAIKNMQSKSPMSELKDWGRWFLAGLEGNEVLDIQGTDKKMCGLYAYGKQFAKNESGDDLTPGMDMFLVKGEDSITNQDKSLALFRQFIVKAVLGLGGIPDENSHDYLAMNFIVENFNQAAIGSVLEISIGADYRSKMPKEAVSLVDNKSKKMTLAYDKDGHKLAVTERVSLQSLTSTTPPIKTGTMIVTASYSISFNDLEKKHTPSVVFESETSFDVSIEQAEGTFKALYKQPYPVLTEQQPVAGEINIRRDLVRQQTLKEIVKKYVNAVVELFLNSVSKLLNKLRF